MTEEQAKVIEYNSGYLSWSRWETIYENQNVREVSVNIYGSTESEAIELNLETQKAIMEYNAKTDRPVNYRVYSQVNPKAGKVPSGYKGEKARWYESERTYQEEYSILKEIQERHLRQKAERLWWVAAVLFLGIAAGVIRIVVKVL